MSAKSRIAVVKGGWSPEREVSLVSGEKCAAALAALGHEAIEIDAGRDLAQRLIEVAPDAIFNALHGKWGEDGCAQGLFELLEIPYTHSGVLASALAMDKQKSKIAFRAAGVPVAESVVADRMRVAKEHVMAPPYVVKPVDQGSSVGVLIIPENANRTAHEAAGSDWAFGDMVMVEAYAPGRELTVAVLGDRALAVTDIASSADFYDYHSKYAQGGSTHIVPADIPKEVEEAALRHALAAHDALGCRGLTRADFRFDPKKGVDGLIMLEINTQPGMTPTSLAPEQAAYRGIDFGALVSWIVDDASIDR